MKRITLIIVALLLASATTNKAEAKQMVDLSKYRHAMCRPEDPDATAIFVHIFYNGNNDRDIDEVAFSVGIDEPIMVRFLTVWSYRQTGDKGKKRYFEKFVYYADLDGEWGYLGKIEEHLGMSTREKEAAQRTLDNVVTLFRSFLPDKHKDTSFRELWDAAGCTTHGPVPFWWD